MVVCVKRGVACVGDDADLEPDVICNDDGGDVWNEGGDVEPTVMDCCLGPNDQSQLVWTVVLNQRCWWW